MKTLIMSLALLLLSLQGFGQRKSKETAKDPKDAQIDSLITSTKNLSLQLDSVSKELVKYVGVYNAIREKVIHYKFDPTRSAYLIDSLKASRDSLSAVLSGIPKSKTASDSLYLVLKEINLLKARIDSIKIAWSLEKSAIPPEEIEKAKAISNLKQLKELLDAKIITDSEFLVIKKKYLEKI
jgi:hypothetical protein